MTSKGVITPYGKGEIIGKRAVLQDDIPAYLVKIRQVDNPDGWKYEGTFIFRVVPVDECETQEA